MSGAAKRSLSMAVRTTDAGWHPHELEQLVALWEAGHTGAYIAGKLGKTRCSVLGKVRRLGLVRKAKAEPSNVTPLRPGPIVTAPVVETVNREPCPRCGVRGDVGCSHKRPPFGFIQLRRVA